MIQFIRYKDTRGTSVGDVLFDHQLCSDFSRLQAVPASQRAFWDLLSVGFHQWVVPKKEERKEIKVSIFILLTPGLIVSD